MYRGYMSRLRCRCGRAGPLFGGRCLGCVRTAGSRKHAGARRRGNAAPSRGRTTAYDDDKDDITTLYLTKKGYTFAEKHSSELQKLLERDVGLGHGDFINLYTVDPKVVARAVKFIGARNVVEIAPKR